MALIQLKNIQKSWQGRGLVKPVSLSFQPDTSYQIVGPNGSGKTTLLKVICGLLTPDLGNVVHNVSFTWCGPKGVGEMPRLTGLENINHMMGILKADESRLEKWRALNSFSEALETEFGLCSEGMKALLSLFISTLGNAQVLVWDEPFSHLSSENTTAILRDWQKLSGAQCLIFTSHEKLDQFTGEVIKVC